MRELMVKPLKTYKTKLKIQNINSIDGKKCNCNGFSSANDGKCCCGNAANTIARR